MTGYVYLALNQTWKILSKKKKTEVFASFSSSLLLYYSSFFPYFSFFLI